MRRPDEPGGRSRGRVGAAGTEAGDARDHAARGLGRPAPSWKLLALAGAMVTLAVAARISGTRRGTSATRSSRRSPCSRSRRTRSARSSGIGPRGSPASPRTSRRPLLRPVLDVRGLGPRARRRPSRVVAFEPRAVRGDDLAGRPCLLARPSEKTSPRRSRSAGGSGRARTTLRSWRCSRWRRCSPRRGSR